MRDKVTRNLIQSPHFSDHEGDGPKEKYGSGEPYLSWLDL